MIAVSREGGCFFYIKKALCDCKELVFEVIWLGGVSSISGTQNGVCREPFPTSYNIHSIPYYTRHVHICRNSQKNRALYINRHITYMETLKMESKNISQKIEVKIYG